MFRPLAFTKTFAMAFASVLSITLVPVLMTVFIRGRRLRPESANPIVRFFTWLYAPVLRLALGWRWTALVVNFAVVPLTLPLLFTIGMYADVSLDMALGEGVVVPTNALLDSGAEQHVFVFQGDGYFQPRPVVVGVARHGAR